LPALIASKLKVPSLMVAVVDGHGGLDQNRGVAARAAGATKSVRRSHCRPRGSWPSSLQAGVNAGVAAPRKKFA